jgi:hypothetical protein
MVDKKRTRETDRETRASIRLEMAKPRMARSARIAELNLDAGRIPEHPSATMPGTVSRIVSSPGPKQPEKAQIAVDGADRGYRDLRIENVLTDEHGDDVRLKKGAEVEITVTAESHVDRRK